ncbi:DMT family transporter [Defluviimonas sp. WL0050]|uniref:DMT family transporter n=1 Tax=Albidovulum litorale TaxID=2984134 RepID=A0ABT2ZM12_9RHOB|nr:DMT family transporter [Defluviimonas sp. WL0050]MCV2872058.1 DMT family transporter [Defluviimonas sp. WL0050]
MIANENLRGAFYMSLAMAAFTINDSCMKAVTAELPLAQAIVLRGALAVLALVVIGMRQGRLRFRFPPGDGRLLIMRSLSEVAATLTFLAALRHMPLANLSAIMQALPLAVTLAAAVALRAPVGWRRMAAIGVGFAGVLLIVRPGTEGFDRWALVGLASVGFVVIRDLSTRRLSAEVPSISVAFLAGASVTVAAACLLPFSGWAPVRPGIAALIGMAAAFLILGYLLIVMAMRVGEVAVVAPFRYTALVFAIALGWVAFAELPDTLTLVGAGIIIATGIYTFHRERRLGQVVATPATPPLRLR